MFLEKITRRGRFMLRNNVNTVKGQSSRNQKIIQLLETTSYGVMSTVSKSGELHAALIYFVVKDDLGVYFMLRAGTTYDNIRQNKNVILMIYEQKSQTVLNLRGTCSEHIDNDTVNKISNQIIEMYKSKNPHMSVPYIKNRKILFKVFELYPEHINVATFKKKGIYEQNEIFNSVESFDFEINLNFST
jgi:general stress protein 26